MWEKIKGVKKKMSTERAVRRPWVLMADWTTVAAAETEERTISERLEGMICRSQCLIGYWE